MNTIARYDHGEAVIALSSVERGRACGPPPKPTLALLATELIQNGVEEGQVGPVLKRNFRFDGRSAFGAEELKRRLKVLFSDPAVDVEHAELDVLRGRRVDRRLVDRRRDLFVGQCHFLERGRVVGNL